MFAVVGSVRTLPEAFPLEKNENAGNMIHGEAPFEMFRDAVHSSDHRAIRAAGRHGFTDFANSLATHVILTLANTLRDGEEEGSRYERITSLVNGLNRPVITFGLGLQTTHSSADAVRLHPAAITMVKTLADQCEVLGVRGQLTADVVQDQCGVSNVQVTGCPSLLSRPDSLVELHRRVSDASYEGRPAFNGTAFHLPADKRALHRAVRADHFIVEPVNRFNHSFFVAASRGVEADPPYFLRAYRSGDASSDGDLESLRELRARYRSNYRLFRNTKDWYTFLRESVSFSYGTRFHCNMAAVLSGRPAIWVTHDGRTRELTEFAALPSIEQEEFEEVGWEGAAERLDYGPFFARISSIYQGFNAYLAKNGMPGVRTFADALVEESERAGTS